MLPTILPLKEELKMSICREPTVSGASAGNLMYYLTLTVTITLLGHDRLSTFSEDEPKSLSCSKACSASDRGCRTPVL